MNPSHFKKLQYLKKIVVQVLKHVSRTKILENAGWRVYTLLFEIKLVKTSSISIVSVNTTNFFTALTTLIKDFQNETLEKVNVNR